MKLLKKQWNWREKRSEKEFLYSSALVSNQVDPTRAFTILTDALPGSCSYCSLWFSDVNVFWKVSFCKYCTTHLRQNVNKNRWPGLPHLILYHISVYLKSSLVDLWVMQLSSGKDSWPWVQKWCISEVGELPKRNLLLAHFFSILKLNTVNEQAHIFDQPQGFLVFVMCFSFWLAVDYCFVCAL